MLRHERRRHGAAARRSQGRGGQVTPYDRIYYIGEQDFYVPRDAKGKFKTYDTHVDAFADTMDEMRKLVPTHVVFNGKVGALTGKNAMPAKVGETVLIVHSQADRELASASGRRSRRLCLGDRQIRKPAGDRS